MSRLGRVNLTNLDKVLYPGTGIRKSEVIEYYIRVAPKILPFLSGRALSRTRFPDGVQENGFYEKDAPGGTPDWVKLYRKESEDKIVNYVVCDEVDTLIWLANLAALELHIPLWRIEEKEKPDLVLIDLDPEPPASFKEVVESAMMVKDVLEDLELKIYVKTSGKKGLHILIPIESKYTFSQTKEWVHTIGIFLSKRSELIVSERSQTKEAGKVLIDYPQNTASHTVICPWSLRGVEGAPISTPVDWTDLKRIKPADLNIRSVISRTDPWKDFWDQRNRLEER